ncbi:MAG: type II toxin-antitoxin system MqsR family toxin [Lachnospiraceae bacterium]|nr:type II toxin-antitoxin system MqsR family toxin [Lachnospiraceae bacterium]
MGNQASVADITAFLERAKRLISAGKYDFVPRRKNMQALAQYGMTIADAKDELLGLVVGDYYKGPKRDFDQSKPGDIWEFKKNVDGIRNPFYVKVKIVQENGQDILKCIGFHDDDYA